MFKTKQSVLAAGCLVKSKETIEYITVATGCNFNKNTLYI